MHFCKTVLGPLHKRRLLKVGGMEGGVKHIEIYLVKSNDAKGGGGHKIGKIGQCCLWMAPLGKEDE